MNLNLAHNFTFQDLHNPEALVRLDNLFWASVPLEIKQEADYSEYIIQLAPYLEDFIAELFEIKEEVKTLAAQHNELAIIHRCKRLFIQRKVLKSYKLEDVKDFQPDYIITDELSYAQYVMDESNDTKQQELYAAWAMLTTDGRNQHKNSVLFNIPKKLDFGQLFEMDGNSVPPEHLHPREGFKLTDPGCSLEYAIDQTHYCIYCHKQGKDSCSKGFPDNKKNDLGVTLSGCPLEEKISEMNKLKSEGCIIGALATIVIDNPMVAATGHRICNDCMRSCIYQKQEPVNIPQIETRILKDVLELPWGVEIYGLLTRWNPLNRKRPVALPDSGYKILVAGMGPAGFTLSHYLLNEGHMVVGIDGLKIEPLSSKLHDEPIYNIHDIYEELDERVPAGFGGVAEYGITVRWNKNYLKIIRILLARRKNFALYGGVRFGSTITYNKALELGFDHIALALGAGRPNILHIPNGVARGVRMASDFLMALQLTGAAQINSSANLQIRLPVVVIGGGLTAMDTATEALAYYAVQVEKFLQQYEQNGDKLNLDEEERIIAEEFLTHARELRATENKLELLRKWGGVTVAYRGALTDATSYRLNYEEMEKALAEGIFFAEHIVPKSFTIDKFGHVNGMITQSDAIIHARTILIATGTQPNTVIAREDPEHFELDGKYFKAREGSVLISDKLSFFGDLHPSYAGNVVKAMASAKNGYLEIDHELRQSPPQTSPKFFAPLDKLLIATIREVNILTDNIIELVIHAPLAAQEFKPGQFYRLQKYGGAMEGIALTGASVADDLISTIILEMGTSTKLCRDLKTGEEVVLMGPTGTATHIASDENVLLVGGGLGNAVLFSIGQAFRRAGSKVVYFAGYRKLSDRFKTDEIERAADVVIWCCDEGLLETNRPQDKNFHGNIVAAMRQYKESLQDIDRIIAIGSDRMMDAVNQARAELLTKKHEAIASINSPMQCMMKEICAQCLQQHIDPVTGIESYVYSCFNQDQPMDLVNFNHLHQRLRQNSLQEKVSMAGLN